MAGAIVFFLVEMFLLGIISGQTTQGQGCSEPCLKCKDITEGKYKGTWYLKSVEDPRCPGKCLYHKTTTDGTETEMCSCDPGPIEYESCKMMPGCSVGEEYDGNCYIKVEIPMTWPDAEDDCNKRNATLASIDNAEANNFVATLAGEHITWIGASDAETEGSWKWTNGDNVLFTNWHNGQPDNLAGEQHCAAINFLQFGKWDDDFCGKSLHPFICQGRFLSKVNSETTASPTEQPTVTFGPGCFSKDTDIKFYDLGKNRHGQNQAPEWIISDEGQTLSQRLNTRPSVGVTNLGLPNEPVNFSGRVHSNSSDDDVIGMVFGYQDETNFFVVASDNNPPGPMNWYVGRLHATCGSSCAAQTTISDAIWDPLHHPQEITVLANGTQHWEYPNVYEFSIWFNPSESLISVNVTVEGGEQVLHSGTVSANTTKTDVDVNSSNGGHIGVYVDSQPNTAWEQLTCQNSIFI